MLPYSKQFMLDLGPVKSEAFLYRLWSRVYRYGSVNEEHAEFLRVRRQLANAIAKARLADGTMYVTESGRDCDGTQYSGAVHGPIPATLAAFDALYDDVAKWADGYFKLSPIPADAEHPRYTTRDLTLEAFEDGHPHVIYS